jgi:phosphatidylinositol alpha 1,6-mannosyltransferase
MAEKLEAAGYASSVRIWGRGVDTLRFSPEKRSLPWRHGLGIGDDEVVVTFVSRLVREKNLDALIDIVQEAERRGLPFRCVIVGNGPDRGYLEQRLRHAVFTGFLEGENLARAYASADVFLFPSDNETFGNVTLEAMACGLPAVCANSTGSRSLVEPEVSGFLATPGNIDEYVGYLERLIGNRDLRLSMGATGLERSHAFTREKAYRQLRSVYDELLIHEPGRKQDA